MRQAFYNISKVRKFILFQHKEAAMENKFPAGKYLASVKIGPKGQIVIPKEVRDMFGLTAGDQLVLMADKGQGIALQPYAYLDAFFRAVNETKGEKE